MPAKKKTYTTPPPVVRIPFKPSYPASDEQKVIFQEMYFGDDHLHIEASPGSGKSTTIKWAMARQYAKMQRTHTHIRAAMLAFSKAIVTEIEPGCAPHVEVRTAHSFGYAALSKKFGRLFLQNNKVQKIVQTEFPNLNPDNFTGPKKGEAFSFLFDVVKLIDMIRANLVDENDPEVVHRICMQYNLVFDDMNIIMAILPVVFKKMMENPNVIDYTDMIYLPIRMDLPIPKFDMLYVDERQDLNSLMIEYVFRMTEGRIMTVGDSDQSIMAFAGADINSTKRLVAKFAGAELPLNVCYRCGTDIVEHAAKIYPKILPFSGNETGVVDHPEELDYEMKDGSMVLSRRNALLIKPCFAFLRRGRKAIIKGKDIGAGLERLVDSMKAKDITDLIDKIEIHREKRIEKLMEDKDVKQSMVERIQDECACITEIASGCQNLDEVKSRIDLIFDEKTQGVTLSSIHRSKGLEADHVSIIDYSRVRICNERMTQEDHTQEKNLEFVAVTRPKKILHLID